MTYLRVSHDPRAHNPFRHHLFRRVLVGRLFNCEVCIVSLHTVILRDNRVQHIMPASAYSNLFDVKDTDKSFRVFLKSRKWIDDQIEAEATFEREHMLASLRSTEQRVYDAMLDCPVTKADIQRRTGLSYHLVRNTIADLTTRNLIEKAGDHQWVAKP